MITIDQAITRTVEVICGGEEKYHKWYTRTVELAELLSKLITGEKIETLLQKFVKREDDAAFEQRTAITQFIQPSVCKNLMDVSYKIPRSNGMKRILTYVDKKESESANRKLKEFQGILNKFWGTHSWDDYMATRFIELNYIDPNSFIVFEWKEFDNKKEHLQPFPFEVYSDMAIDYLYINKVLQYLLVKTDTTPFLEKKTELRYTLYLPDQTITFDYVDKRKNREAEDKFIERIVEKIGVQLVRIEDINITNQKVRQEFYVRFESDEVYKVTYLVPHNLGSVPAIQVGFVGDLHTHRVTFRNPFDAAIPYLMKMIKTVSELDITMADHAMPQKITYQNPCTNCKGSGQSSEGECPMCKGMKYQISSSALDAITIKLPQNATPDKIIDLERLIHYVRPPVDIIEFQDRYVDKLFLQCVKAVYGDKSIRRDQVNITATESIFDESKTYDALYPFTKKYSNVWETGIDFMAKLTDLSNGLTRSMRFSKDLKFLDKTDYIEQLKELKAAGGSVEAQNIIDDEIIRLDYSDSPEMMKRHETKRVFKPFRDKTEDETKMIVSTLSTTNKYRVLWEFFNEIFSEIELEQGNNGVDFYSLELTKQVEIVEAKTQEFIDELQKEKTQSFIDMQERMKGNEEEEDDSE